MFVDMFLKRERFSFRVDAECLRQPGHQARIYIYIERALSLGRDDATQITRCVTLKRDGALARLALSPFGLFDQATVVPTNTQHGANLARRCTHTSR